MAHKCHGVKCGAHGNQIVHKSHQERTHNYEYRQYDGSGSNKQQDQPSIGKTLESQQEDLRVLYGTKQFNLGSIPAKTPESERRLPVQRVEGLQRLKIRREGFPNSFREHVCYRSRPICHQNQCSSEKIRQLEARYRSDAIDSFQIPWENIKRYAFPPFCLIGRVLKKIIRKEATVTLIAPIWPAQAWYPTLLQLLI